MPVIQTHCIACGRKFITPIISNIGKLCKDCASQGLFRKQIIITGITRMNNGHVCISGIDPDTWRFVRPIFPAGLNRDFVMQGASQVVNHFNLVEIEFKQYRPSEKFHTEDWIINEKYAPRFIRHLNNEEILNVVNKTSITNLNSAIDTQDKSLFTVKAKSIGRMWHEQYERTRVFMSFVDWDGNLYNKVPVTDLLTMAYVLYEIKKGNMNYSKPIISQFNNNTNRFIRIGLTREWQGQHWKQVTALITIPDLFDGKSFSYYEKQLGDNL